MNLGLTVLGIVAPVFGLAFAGWLWVRLGFEYRVAFVTRLAMGFAVPCLIFVALMETEIPPGVLGRMTMAAVAGYLAVGFVFAGVVAGLGLDRRSRIAATPAAAQSACLRHHPDPLAQRFPVGSGLGVGAVVGQVDENPGR